MELVWLSVAPLEVQWTRQIAVWTRVKGKRAKMGHGFHVMGSFNLLSVLLPSKMLSLRDMVDHHGEFP